MDHHTTWLSLLPGYQAAQAWFRAHGGVGILGNPIVLQHVVAGFLVAVLVVWLSASVRRAIVAAGNSAVVPGPHISLRNGIEVVAESLRNQMHQIIGKNADQHFPMLFSLTMFVFFSNILGLIPGLVPPTDNWNTTFACGIYVFVYYNFHGLKTQGLGHIAHMANPTGLWWGWFLSPLLFPIELVSHIARPLSLGVRLAANMVGDHAVLLAFLGLMPILVPLPFLALGLIVAIVQTLVFVLLSMIYIALATAHSDAAH